MPHGKASLVRTKRRSPIGMETLESRNLLSVVSAVGTHLAFTTPPAQQRAPAHVAIAPVLYAVAWFVRRQWS